MTMKKFLAMMFALVMVFTMACGGGGETASSEEDEGEDDGEEVVSTTEISETTAAAPAAAAADGATVMGLVKFEGAPPTVGNLQMSADPVCSQAHPTAVKAEEVVLGAGGELANVFVYVKDYRGAVPPPSAAAVLDQKGCQYRPHVSGIQVGQTLQIKNSDPTLHNVHAMAKANKEFNVGQPVQGMVSDKKFDKPEIMLKFKCDVHSWMNSYMGVVAHPYFGVSSAAGTFNINNLPPGTYTLEAWHEKFGTQTQQITVGPKESKQVTFTFKA